MTEKGIIENNKFLLTDLISGNESVSKRSDFEDLSYEQIRETIRVIMSDKNASEAKKEFILSNMWKIHYKQKPPTINDFLSADWIGPTSLNVFPHVRSVLNRFWAPDSYERNLLLVPCIGWGKSTATAISVLYVMTHMNLLRDPKQFFGLAQASSIVAVLGSFTIAKAKQVLLKPFLNILRSSPKFRKVQNEDRVEMTQKEEYEAGTNKIVWTSASKMEGAIQFSNDLHILIVSDFASLLGLSIITGALSEVSFFMDKGVSIEDIDRMYSDLKSRVWNRFGYRYFATTIMDSSPNSFDSPIDKYVFSGEAEKEPRNLVVTSTHWDVYKDIKPESYKQWIETGETFPVFRGNGSKPALMIAKDQIEQYSPTEIFNVPIDLYPIFNKTLAKAVKDYCGWPSGSDSKLIDDFNYIEKMFCRQLRNIYSYIIAAADKKPEKLIWDQVYKNFFIEVGKNHYEFYRAPYEKRWISVDLAESQDVACIACVHPELNIKGELVIVTDFTIVIIPTKERINLDAIEYFIIDLKRLGRLNIAGISYDQFQSSQSRQALEREEFEVDRLSVDITMNPYLVYISWIKNERIKAGRNIFVKNNLKSLQETKLESGKKKIDHLKGRLVYDDGGNWETSLQGINAKDATDAHSAACFQCINACNSNFIPRYQWTEYEESTEEELREKMKTKVLDQIHSKYSFKVREDTDLPCL